MPQALFILALMLIASATIAKVSDDIGTFTKLCGVSFQAVTQMGEMEICLSVCALESEGGRDTSLYVLSSYERNYPAHVEAVIERAHSPVIEKNGEVVTVLYTTGANTTCVVNYTIREGVFSASVPEAIAWNEAGVYRTSESFEKYAYLLDKRNEGLARE